MMRPLTAAPVPRERLNDNPPVLVCPSLGDLFVSSALTHLTSTHSATHHRPTLPPESPALVLLNSSGPGPMTIRPSHQQQPLRRCVTSIAFLQPLHVHQFPWQSLRVTQQDPLPPLLHCTQIDTRKVIDPFNLWQRTRSFST